MKDSILNTALGAFTLAGLLFIAFDNGGAIPQSALTQAADVPVLEKTVVTASRLR